MNKNCSNCGAGVTSAPEYNTASACGNPPTQLRTVTIPKNKGGDGKNDPYAPQLGAWQNTVVVYQKTGSVYLYDVNGVYTNLTGTDYASEILAMQDDITNLQAETSNLNQSIATEVLQRREADSNLQSNINAVSQALATEATNRADADTSLSQQITAIQTQVNQIGSETDEMTKALAADVAALQTNINAEVNARTEADTELQTNINANANAIAALQTAVGGENSGLTKSVLYTLGASTDVSTVTLSTTSGALNNPDPTVTDIALPVASATQAGVLNAATYAAFQNNSDDIDSILNGAVALSDLPATPTQDELTEAWKTATSKEDLINRASIYDSTNNKIWYYYTNTGQWAGISSSESTVTITTATNTSLGLVMGSTADGQITVEGNGTMSLNGWDEHVAAVANNTTQIAALNATIGTIQSVLTRLNTGTGAA